MTGNSRALIIPQARDLRLLTELVTMRIIDREQAKVVAGFRSTTRANTRLLELVRARLLRRFFVGSVGSGRKAVYTLSPKGTELIGAKTGGIHRPAGRLVVGDRFVEHQSGINEIYLALKYRPAVAYVGRLQRWIVFRQRISHAIRLMPDAYFEIESGGSVRGSFLEVDLGTEALSVWEQKITYYIQLAVSGEFHRHFHQPQFRVLVIAPTDGRLGRLRSTIAKKTDKIFWLTTVHSIHRLGLWSPIWLRPSGDQPQALL